MLVNVVLTGRSCPYVQTLTVSVEGIVLDAVATQLNANWVSGAKTIKRYLAAGGCPEVAAQRKMPSLLDPYEPYLKLPILFCQKQSETTYVRVG